MPWGRTISEYIMRTKFLSYYLIIEFTKKFGSCFFIITSKENVSVALPSVILASEGFLVNKQWWKLPSPHYYYCFKEKKLLLKKKWMIVVLLHKYILTKTFHWSLSYLIVEFAGKKKSTDAKNQSVSSTLSLYRRRRVILKIRLNQKFLKKTRVKKPLKKRKWMGRKCGPEKWSISNFGLVSENIYLRFFVPRTWGKIIDHQSFGGLLFSL